MAAEEAMRVIPGNAIVPQLSGRLRVAPLALAAILSGIYCPRAAAAGMTPESPEVKKVVDAGLKHLEGQTHDKLGGKCLIALAFAKAERGEHAQVVKAVAACE